MSVRAAAKALAPRVLGERRWDALRLARRADNLTWLGRYFGTDKAGPRHHYTPIYQRFFSSFRTESFVLLEIGIGGYSRAGQGGASLRMWKHYFPHAQVVGVDIEDKSFVTEPRIRAFQGDQTDAERLRDIVDQIGRPRIIVDDGSHRPEHTRATFRILFPLLRRGGYYVIEDTQTSYWPKWGGSTDRSDPTTTMALVKDLIDGLNYVEFRQQNYRPTYTDRNIREIHCFHNLVIIKKGRNDATT
jgi:hypothetical protein